ncbi:uncharacterized protein LOC130902668 isoform X1 [Diorhabda carinulata]|uniref:uncharacterized protein LOC130902668 isoform X1 n=2 Tax=Diorhabda carinulata TaxID=1163345 RepID=UPI0025A003E8|nr:uncharacterized protein LOC130902668 isoform X1 [Diorhabda carinulata]
MFSKIITIIIIVSTRIDQMLSRKVTIETQYLIRCSNPDLKPVHDILTRMDLTRVNRTTMVLSYDIDVRDTDKLETTILLQKFSNGVWLKQPFIPYIPEPCKLWLRLFSGTMNDVIGKNGTCPLPPGHYSTERILHKREEFETGIPISGRLKFELVVRKIVTKEIIFCVEGVVILT